MSHAYDAIKNFLNPSPFSAEMTPQQLVDTLDQVWSKTAMQVKSAMKDAQLQGIYAVLFSQVRLECNRTTWEDQPVVYTSVANRSIRKELPTILLVAAAVLILLTAYILDSKKYTLGMLLCSIALVLLIASIALQAIKGESASHRVEKRMRPQSIEKALMDTAAAMDANAQTLLKLVNPVGTSHQDLEALVLVRELYNAAAHEDENVHSALLQYLRENGVKEVQYSTETASLFDLMPSNGTRTIRPALVQETATGSHIVDKGLACIQMFE